MSDMSMKSVYRGGCLCGSVRYEIAAAPGIAGFCYCLNCRKSSGAGHAFHVLFPENAVAITGEVRGYDWKAGSGNTATTSFCPTCGSPLFGKSTGMPGMMTLRVASLDDPAAVQPQMAVYTKRLLSWDHLDPALQSFPAMPQLPAMT